MKHCSKCGRENEVEANFCESCGNPLTSDEGYENEEATVFASDEVSFEEVNSHSESISNQEVHENHPNDSASSFQNKTNFTLNFNQKNKLPIYIGVAALGLIVLFIGIKFILGFTGSDSKNLAFYIKNDKFYYTDFSKDEPISIISKSKFEDPSSFHFKILKDGKHLLYKSKEEGGAYTLQIKNLNKPDAEDARIDSNIINFYLSSNQDLINYEKNKNDQNVLYQKSIKNPDREEHVIAKKYDSYDFSADGKKLFYTQSNGDDGSFSLYYNGDTTKEDNEAVKLEKNIKSNPEGLGYFFSPKAVKDFSEIYYLNEKKLLRHDFKKEEADTIAEDVYRILSVYEDGSAYYIKANKKKENLLGLIHDDLKAKDDKIKIIKEPEYVEEPYRESYKYEPSISEPTMPGEIDFDDYYQEYYYYSSAKDTNLYNSDLYQVEVWRNEEVKEYKNLKKQYDKELKEGNELYEKDLKAYNNYVKELKEYQANRDLQNGKERNEALRSMLKAMEVETYSLYYYNGEKEELLTENLTNNYDFMSYTHPFLYCGNLSKETLSGIKLSQIIANEPYSVEDFFNRFEDKKETLYFSENKAVVLDFEDAEKFDFNGDGSIIYFGADFDKNKELYTLYQAKRKGAVIEAPTKIKEDVSYFRILDNGDLLVFQDMKDDMGTLYLNDKKISDDVYIYSIYDKTKDEGRFFFATDKNYYNKTVYYVVNDKKVKVSDDLYDFVTLPNKQIYFIKDYDKDDNEGELHLFKKEGETEKITEGVSGLFNPY